MLTQDVLNIDSPAVSAEIEEAIRRQVRGELRRRGAVLGLSGGIDSSVVAALCARALGRDKVVGLLMPERDSSPDSTALGRKVAESLGIEVLLEDIGPALSALGCYRRQEEAIRSVFPDYGEGWKCKLSLPPLLDRDRLSVSSLTVEDPAGARSTARLPHAAYLGLVAATSFKQRVRKTMEYYHADRLHYAVAGTPNRLEHDQGFFVKQGDGAADLKPIAHLFKSQVYQLAEYLGIPEEVRRRTPTTDTFSLPQTQEEFYFALPWHSMDLCLWGRDRDVPASEVAAALALETAQVERVYHDIDAKRRATRSLHMPPLLVRPRDGTH